MFTTTVWAQCSLLTIGSPLPFHTHPPPGSSSGRSSFAMRTMWRTGGAHRGACRCPVGNTGDAMAPKPPLCAPFCGLPPCPRNNNPLKAHNPFTLGMLPGMECFLSRKCLLWPALDQYEDAHCAPPYPTLPHPTPPYLTLPHPTPPDPTPHPIIKTIAPGTLSWTTLCLTATTLHGSSCAT